MYCVKALRDEKRSAYSAQLGDNFITAWAAASSGKVSLNKSFQIYGVPDVPDHFRYMSGDGNSGLVNTAAGSLAVLVEDQYDNPLSNKTVSFTVTSAKPVDGSVTLPQPPQAYRSLQLYTRESCPQSPYITYPDCRTALKTSLTVTSEAIGMAMTESMFGDTLGTEYTVDIATTAFPPKLPLVENPLTIHLYTVGKWKEGLYIAPYLQASMYETSGNHGGITDGAKVKTELSQPMKVQIILSRPGYSVESASGVPYLRGTGLFAAEPVTNAMLTATTITGGAIPTPVENGHDNGIYEFKIKMGNDPEKNVIEITGSAPVKVPHIAESDQKEDITLNLPIGKDICFKHSSKDTGDRCDWGDQQTPRQWALPPKKTFTSVLPEVATPPILLLDDNGLLAQDVTLQYSIKPTDYTAGQAYLVIYEDNVIFRYAFASVQGTGSLIFSKGSKFDSTKNYTVELVLNYGSDMEMRSDKVVLPVAQINVLTDEGAASSKVAEIKFGIGSKVNKRYKIEMTSSALQQACTESGSLKGTIQSITSSGELVTAPKDGYKPASYNLDFTAVNGRCLIGIKDSKQIKDKFIVSNMSVTTLTERITEAKKQNIEVDLNSMAVLYGGLGNKIIITINGITRAIPLEPVGVIVLGIDGLRQDVLYPDTMDDVKDGGKYRVNIVDLPGLKQILSGYDQLVEKQQYVMLPKVTAIFPSITFASWASILTGKMPKDTGILGNEFFARDLYKNNKMIIGLEDFPLGMVTLDADGGAFRPREGMLASPRFALKYAIPSEFLEPTYTGRLALSTPMSVVTATPLWPDIGSMVGNKYQNNSNLDKNCEGTDYECRTVSIFNQYPKGADQWGTGKATAKIIYDYIKTMGDSAKLLDNAATERAVNFINNYFLNLNANNKKRFPAVFSVYLAGLDHDAHLKGMGNYVNFIKTSTDPRVADIVKALKDQDEFDNKIFIVVADHGHTAMPLPEQMTLDEKDENGNVIKTWHGDASCELKVNGFGTKKVKFSEKANNSLHIWELGEMFKAIGISGGTQYKVLAPQPIANLYTATTSTGLKYELSYGATATIGNANVIAALNGPMAHIYLKGTNGWPDENPDVVQLSKLAQDIKNYLMDGGVNIDDNDTKTFFNKLLSSVDRILIRVDGVYKDFNGVETDVSGNVIGPNAATINETYFDANEYVSAFNRITGLNHLKRSGDLVLIMKDKTTETVNDRYSTAYGCKSWHGSLNPSDSYVPFIVAYPGGNKLEMQSFIDATSGCSLTMGCDGNWRVTDLIKAIVQQQYGTQ